MKRSYGIGAAMAAALLVGGAGLYFSGAFGSRGGPSTDQVLAMDLMPLVGKDDKCAYHDAKGVEAFAARFDYASLFLHRSGLAIVELGKKYGIIDRKGNYTANPQFEDLRTGDGDTLFFAKLGENWGIVDQTGKYVANRSSRRSAHSARMGSPRPATAPRPG